jgi:hypothetical protein
MSNSGPDSKLSKQHFIWLAVQLGLVLGVAIQYRIEFDRALPVLAGVLFVGFLIHSWLPIRTRVLFFLFLTGLTAAILLKWNSLWLAASAFALLAICHLHINWWARVLLLICAGSGLASIQIGWLENPGLAAVVPILGSMFMFRIILYMYDLKNDCTPAPLPRRFAYFFMPPNICFPLFPVVDYKTFINTYYDTGAPGIYQKGIFWMMRGVCHLLLYRLIYYLMPMADSNLNGVLGVYVFMAMTYALYLRVSGIFHLIVGSLCLFGFNLPQTNNNYFLATSFTDLWRRINIYWKDFMSTIVFYPILMALRRMSMSRRLILSTALVFLVTWFLHSYQWFWLQGIFPVRSQDILFWGVLGAILVVNTIVEAGRGRRRLADKDSWSLREAVYKALCAVGVFSLMAMLWTLWYSETVVDWGYRVLSARESDILDWIRLAVLLCVVVAGGVVGQWLAARGWKVERLQGAALKHAPRLVPMGAIVLLLLWSPVEPDEAEGRVERLVSRMRSTEPNRIDRERQERGYYEALSRSIQLHLTAEAAERDEWMKLAAKAEEGNDWVSLHNTKAIVTTGDIRGAMLAPNISIEFKGEQLHTNQWGMRDREYERAKGDSSFRLAVLGASTVMGSGVADDETFENILEGMLNGDSIRSSRKYEVLNFGMSGYAALQALFTAQEVAAHFTPDAVIYVAHPGEGGRLVSRMRMALEQGAKLGPGLDFVERILEESGARPGLPSTEFERRLRPYEDQLTRWVYQQLVAASRSYDAEAVFVFLPLTDDHFGDGELRKLIRQAEEAGGTVIVMNDLYEGQNLDTIRIAVWDNHPNARGHRLIADRLYAELKRTIIP